MDFFEKLMLGKEITFTDGRIVLLGQRFVIAAVDIFAEYTFTIAKNQKLINKLYNTAKHSVATEFGVNIGKSFSFSFGDYSNWFINIATFGGWGNIKWEDLDKEKHRGILKIENSPVGSYLKGKVESPCDHIIRGLMAGGASSAFKVDVDIIEQECIALGDQQCKFVIDSSDSLKEKFPVFFEKQLKVY